MNRAEDIGKKIIVVRTAAAFFGKGYVHRITFEVIQGNMANDRHVLRGMIPTDTAVVLMEGHI